MNRRRFANWSLKTGIVAAIAAVIPGVITLRGRSRVAATRAVSPGDRLVFALGQNAGQPVTQGGFTQNEAVLAYPEGKSDNHENLVVVCKLDPAAIKPPTDMAGAAQGVVAYSAICTHLGCTVRAEALPQPQTVTVGGAAMRLTHRYLCPCHGSKYTGDGTNVAGPAPRPLAWYHLSIATDDGQLVVDLAREVGHDFRLTIA